MKELLDKRKLRLIVTGSEVCVVEASCNGSRNRSALA
jgi:hypothetical protein